LMRAPQLSLSYGFFMALVMAIVVWLAWAYGSQWFMLAMRGGFVFIAPLSCTGLYAISAQLERGQEPSMVRSLRAAFKRHIGNEMVFAIALLIVFLVWARAAVMISVFFPVGARPEFADLVPYLTIGTAVGAFFAIVTFSVSAFSLPMIMHRDVDSITAIVTSVNAVLRNKGAMIVWLTIIIGALALGVVTAFVGLIVMIPVIGYATWHGYEETIDAGEFPRHSEGITATPRPSSSSAMEHDPVI
ncbi:MAG: DUF2189 domain-containing protein, partial [Gammaproteobacteria bacterium]|nr:DUF2189 domain-containing protein [Gammaproteobacteria bacterium]